MNTTGLRPEAFASRRHQLVADADLDAVIRSLIVTRPARQPRSGNWTP